MRNRLVFIALLSVIVASYAAAQTAPSAPQIKVRRLSPRAAVFELASTNVLAIATQKGIVVVDAGYSPAVGKAYRDAIQAEFKRNDFAYLINSHDHGDHYGGNLAYVDLPIIGHVLERQRLLNDLAYLRDYYRKNDPAVLGTPQFTQYANVLPNVVQVPSFAVNETNMKRITDGFRGGVVVVPPTLTFDSQLTLFMGDVSVRLLYYGHAHSATDTLISVPEENLVFSGGLFFKEQIPIFGVRGEPVGNRSHPGPEAIDHWIAILHSLLDNANDRTQFIASHERETIGKADMLKTLAYIEKLRDEVHRAKAEGKTLEQAKASLTLKERFPEVAGWRDERNRGTSYETLGIHQYNIDFLWKTLGK